MNNLFNKIKAYFNQKKENHLIINEYFNNAPQCFKKRFKLCTIIDIILLLFIFFCGIRVGSDVTSKIYNDSSSSNIITSIDNHKVNLINNGDGTYTANTYIFGGEDSSDDNDLSGCSSYVVITGDIVESTTNNIVLNSDNVIVSGSDSDCFYNVSLDSLPSTFNYFSNYFSTNSLNEYFVCFYDYSQYMRIGWLVQYSNATTFNLKIVRYNAENGSLIGTYPCLTFTSSSYSVSSSGASYLKYFFGYNSVITSYSSIVFNNTRFSVGSINSDIVDCFYKTFAVGGVIEEFDFKPYLVLEFVIDYFYVTSDVGGAISSSSITSFTYSFSCYFDWIEDEYDRYERDDNTRSSVADTTIYSLFKWSDLFKIDISFYYNVGSNIITPYFNIDFEDIYDGSSNPYSVSFNDDFTDDIRISNARSVTPAVNYEYVNNNGDLMDAFFTSGASTNALSYSAGYETGKKDGYTEGFEVGSAKGFQEGYESADGNLIGDLIFSIADIPFQILSDFIGFEILGFNVLQFVTGILGLLLTIFLIKIFI